MTDWTWIAASRRGTAHAQAGERRQDACRVMTAEPGFLIAVACDGAGSAVFGGYGAAIAARVLTNRAADWLSSTGAIPAPAAIDLWVAEVRLMILFSADRIDCSAGDFAATLVMAISDGFNTITAHIGDGAIIARQPGSLDLVELSWPESGEHASTTYFITDLNLRLRIGVLKDYRLDRIALLTDGIERLALDFVRRVAHRPFFDGLFKTVTSGCSAGANRPLSRQLAAFLDSDGVNTRTDDDKTLILAALG
ncbi:PP2C family serine/threonine-protein phosphatase [Sphingomonas sp. 10B4]|uniref:PP2C family serine/threonine-protein phosphatase n=1 Tax=Sphingomonas sp. 10B4 TaxID=3048575 RepID=UPI002AB5D32A|nr:PP2C family serine/threonine-protein phosphatase [Sphingomonas sp. 10B4]MDY7524632.1 PP2C family serine/threonine-protein phosphatase [Sphingomonas sp. 10B4]MEB0282413.1 PP2C family serine/threonine-protein phosphatase [Sphingomonas sp. 10B4]